MEGGGRAGDGVPFSVCACDDPGDGGHRPELGCRLEKMTKIRPLQNQAVGVIRRKGISEKVKQVDWSVRESVVSSVQQGALRWALRGVALV